MERTMNKLVILIGLSVAALASCADKGPAGSAEQIGCPKAISVKQTLGRVERGWESFEDDTPLRLISVAFYEGHPREKAALAPDEETEVGGRLISTWHLVENGRRHYWMVCYYDHTRIVLTRMIGPEIHTCEVRRDPHVSIAGHPALVDITFK